MSRMYVHTAPTLLPLPSHKITSVVLAPFCPIDLTDSHRPLSVPTPSLGSVDGPQLAHGDGVVGARRRRRGRHRRRGRRHCGINDVGLRVSGGQGELRSRGIACRRHVIRRREGRGRRSTDPGDPRCTTAPAAASAAAATAADAAAAAATTDTDTDTPDHPQPRRGGSVQRVHRADRDAPCL